MTRERAKELLPFIQAYAEGKVIQWRDATGKWGNHTDAGYQPVWADTVEYRIRPSPREFSVRKCLYHQESPLIVSSHTLPKCCESAEIIRVREVL